MDEVGRELTSAAPDETFGRRVTARLERPESGARRRRLRAFLWAAPAAAGLVLAALVVRQQSGPDVRPGASTMTSHTATVAPTAVRATGISPTSAARPRTVSATGASGFGQSVVRGPDASAETIPAIEVGRIDVPALVPAKPIEIAAIAIDRIEMTAMR